MRPKFTSILIIFLLVFSGFILLSTFVEYCKATGSTIYVDDSGGANYTKIQDAIGNASDGDTIYVYNGTYNENIVINKSITLQGEDKSTTIIDGTGIGYVVNITSNYVNLSNLTVQNGDDCAIYIISGCSYNSIFNCIINNTSYGIFLLQASWINISNNLINNSDDTAISLWSDTSHCRVFENNIKNNNYGIKLFAVGSNNWVYHNNFINNTHSASGSCYKWDNGYPSGGNYWDDFDEPGEGAYDNNSDGIVDSPYDVPSGYQDSYPLMYELTIPPSFVWIDDDFISSTLGWGEDHFNCIQDGINALEENGAMYVFNGTYDNVWINKTLTIVGENKNTTVIDGSGVGHVVYISADWVNISGFSIQNSETNYTGVFVYSNYTNVTNNILTNNGYGVYFNGSSNNTFLENTVTNNSYGIYLYNSSYININLNDVSSIESALFVNISNYNSISNNSMETDNVSSIVLYFSNNNNIVENVFINSSMIIYGDQLDQYIHTIENNTVNEKPLYYYKHNNSGLIVPSDTGAVILVDCTNATIADANISHVGMGIEIAYSENITFTNISLTNTVFGIRSIYSDNDTIQNNTLNNNLVGILIEGCKNNMIKYNNFTTNTLIGLSLNNSNNNTIYTNYIKNNLLGLSLNNSNDNMIYNNYFNNTINTIDDSTNTWNTTKNLETNIIEGVYLGGNYWNDYTGFDTDHDGLGNMLTPYNSSENITTGGDFYPLIVSPNVSTPSPANGSTTVSVSANIVITFDKSMNPTTTNGNFSTSPSVSGSYTWSNNDKTLTFNPSSDLSGNKIYKITISWNATDASGNVMLHNYSWSFTTGSSGGGSSPPSGGGGGWYIPSGDTGDDETILTDPPIANPSGPYNALTFQSIRFDGSGSTDNGTIIDYQWTFGDGVTGWGIKPTHIYNKSGVFVVTLTVTDDTNLTDTENTTVNIKLDTDGDGWSDEDEEYYGSDKTNADDAPLDTDNDGILDFDDEDDDNDIISDEIETILGTNPKVKDITIKVINGIVFYLIDLDDDGIPDRFYNTSSEKNVTVKIRDDGTYLLNIDSDAYWDYVYDPASGEATNYEETPGSSDELPWFTIASVIIIIIIAIIVMLYLFGYIWIGEE